DLVIWRKPKSPLSRQAISPPHCVVSWAVLKSAQGAARVQAVPPPVDDTKVVNNSACAGSAGRYSMSIHRTGHAVGGCAAVSRQRQHVHPVLHAAHREPGG